ncbi:hypothetical protein BC830DRAFT_1103056 [Chytriomyces sp. MP71]|nr:hypothetical protein BC830DRAFT_1103056 [Chytriomyces sp. MP71]
MSSNPLTASVVFSSTVPVHLLPAGCLGAGDPGTGNGVGTGSGSGTGASDVLVVVTAEGDALLLTLTRPNDAFFLYKLVVRRDAFAALRERLSLRVGFDAFASSVVDLLLAVCRCHAENSEKFVAQLNIFQNNATLSVVETNPFRHIVHLALDFVQGNDAAVKTHLADMVVELKKGLANAQNHLKATEEQLNDQLRVSQASAASYKSELEKLKIAHAEQASRLELSYSQRVSHEKEEALRLREAMRSGFEKEKRELEQGHDEKIRSLTSELASLQSTNNSLQSRLQTQDNTVATLQSKLSYLQSDYTATKSTADNLAISNNALSQQNKDWETTCAALRDRVHSLEAGIQERNERIQNLIDENRALGEARARVEETIEMVKAQNVGLEDGFKKASEEINKGNEIIRKIQGDLKSAKAKIKLKNVVTLQQEKLLDERASLIEMHEKDIVTLKESLAKSNSEAETLRNKVDELTKSVEDGKKLISENTHVIEWLHKQLNEEALNKPAFGAGGTTYARLDFERYGTNAATATTTATAGKVNNNFGINLVKDMAQKQPSSLVTGLHNINMAGDALSTAKYGSHHPLSSSPTRSVLFSKKGPSPARDTSSLNTFAAGVGVGGLAGKSVNANAGGATGTHLVKENQGMYGTGIGQGTTVSRGLVNPGFPVKKSNYF